MLDAGKIVEMRKQISKGEIPLEVPNLRLVEDDEHHYS
jgi:hypothetical protein